MLSYVLLIGAVVGGAIAQMSDNSTGFFTNTLTTTSGTTQVSAQTTILGWPGTTSGFVGSIVGANACETTVVVVCTDAIYCPSVIKGIPLTYTQGPFDYEFGYSTTSNGVVASTRQYCSLQGPLGSPTKAVCALTVSASAAGTQTSTTTTTTASGALLQQNQIPITAGADKLASVNGTCTAAPPRNAAPGSRSTPKLAGLGAIALVFLAIL